MKKQEFISILFYIIVLFCLLLAYNYFSYLWSDIKVFGGCSFYIFEIPLTIVSVLFFYFPNIKNKIIRYFIPILPLLIFYIFFDVFYAFLIRVSRYSDFENIFSIYDFYPSLFFGTILLSIAFLYLMYLLFASAYRADKSDFKSSLTIRIVFLVTLLSFTRSDVFQKYHDLVFEYIIWSDKTTIQINGRLSSFIYYSNLEIKNQEKIKTEKLDRINIVKTLYSNPLVEKRNVHIIILESFINPNFIKDVKFNQNPLAKELIPYLNDNGEFSKIISPVYGGGTAQAEFEILTGIKALRKVNTIEFNIMKGGKLQGFINQFKNNGYNTLATVATSSAFFNSRLAYQSLGFEKVRFLEEEEDFKKDETDKFIFDGDIFEYNLKIIQNHLQSNKNKPIFNYVLGMYGHIPYYRNESKRPKIINLKNSNYENKNDIDAIANQFYYRTKALADYLNKLAKIDPNAIVLVLSDHIPSILRNTTSYNYDKHTNIGLLINKGDVVDISGRKYYQIPWQIWDILADKTLKRDESVATLEKLYFKALRETIQ